ncbi:hypothetical protein Back2_21330 [Nocardioides baekrokdamisoli]|uniref:YCII-related domain-containing protein n=1 Tax=Nocardioides baekrokdamisoli TaxID=1804624 RepID=A0A3G9IHM5_9ACTN|nr:hypothetical protein [Nocardioides baekrokdamisoli]BBH17846.1 hypothetical protein Back2_21330 [Nocardioides baekrokdamisoli]
MGLFVVRYDYRDGSEATQDVHRAAHRDWLAAQPGLRAAGKTDDNGGVLIFEDADAESLAVLLKDDPFLAVDVIGSTKISGWAMPLGTWKAPLGL